MTVSQLRSWLLLAFCLTACEQNLLSQCSQQAHNTIEKYLDVSYRGAFIGGSKLAFEDSLSLTMNDGFPPEWPVVFVDGYKIIRDLKTNGGCRFTISFEKKGIINDDLVFRAIRQTEVARMWVVCSGQSCKVDMADERYGLSPHVGQRGISAWLDKLRTGEQSARAAALQKAISLAGR